MQMLNLQLKKSKLFYRNMVQLKLKVGNIIIKLVEKNKNKNVELIAIIKF